MRLERAVPDATARLDSGIERLPDAQRTLFDGVRFGARGDLDVSRVLANVAASGPSDASARARALEALEALFAFAIFEARNRLGQGEAEALRREVGKIQMGG
jgi:hypothetical protein